MALHDLAWFVSSVAHAAVTARPQNTAVAAGVVRRQFTAPAVNSERCFVAIVAGTTANVTDATWVLTRGAKTTDGTATWQECTGHPAVNGDATNTTLSSAVRSAAITLGDIVKNNSATHYFICSTAGTAGASEPSYVTTAGSTTTDSGCTWTCIGAVGSFSAWGGPHARLTNAYANTWGTAGNKFWIADNHAETQSTAMTLSNPTTLAGGPTYTICIDHTAAMPPVEANYNTGATISTTSNTNITFQFPVSFGTMYYQGIAFSAGNGSTSSGQILFNGAAATYICKNCAFILGNSNAASTINAGLSSGLTSNQILWDNCTVQFAATGQSITLRSANFEWRNTPSAIQGATIPTSLFVAGPGLPLFFACRGVDLSAFNGQLLASNTQCDVPLLFEDCKFHASMTRYGTSATAGYSSSPVVTVRCDSGGNNYQSTRDEYSGTQTVETSITRVGGATDGTTATSDKIVTNSQATFLTPYRMLPLAIWNETTGADVTVTVYGTINSASLPTDGEIYMDVQYLGSSGSPVASFKTTAKSHPLATAANVSSDGSSWNGGGSGAGWSPFKLVATLTSPQPQMKGFIYINVRAAKASATYYVDPLPTLS